MMMNERARKKVVAGFVKGITLALDPKGNHT
jgi:hypothetical protein